jgi:hypothetical protein
MAVLLQLLTLYAAYPDTGILLLQTSPLS